MIVPMNADELDAKLRAWREQHNTPEKVAAAHQNVLLDRVVQSMDLRTSRSVWSVSRPRLGSKSLELP